MKTIQLFFTLCVMNICPIFGADIFKERVWNSYKGGQLTGKLLKVDGHKITIKPVGKAKTTFNISLLSHEHADLILDEQKRIETLIDEQNFKGKTLKASDLAAAYKFGKVEEMLKAVYEAEAYLQFTVKDFTINNNRNAVIVGEHIAFDFTISNPRDKFFKRGDSVMNRLNNEKLFTIGASRKMHPHGLKKFIVDLKETSVGVEDMLLIVCEENIPNNVRWGFLSN